MLHSPTYTLTQAVSQAKQYNLIVADTGSYCGLVASMKAAKPQLN